MRISARIALMGAVLMVGFSVQAQDMGLSGIAVPQSDGSVMSYMQQRRLTGQNIDGDTASRVFGGRKAQDGAWPSQVALFAKAQPRPDQQGDEPPPVIMPGQRTN